MADAPAHPSTVFDHCCDLPPPDQPIDAKVLPAHGGVYAFADEHDRVIQTVHAQNIRRTVTLRFERGQDATSKRADLRAIARKIWWRPAFSVFESTLAHLEVIRRTKPERYGDEIAFAPAWFATIGTADQLPRWQAVKRACHPGAIEIGPFVRRKHSEEYIAQLEDLFDLCRYHHILDQTPNGQACTYYDIGRCPAPCDGTVSIDDYRKLIDDSIRFAAASPDERFQAIERRMKCAAGDRNYTLAARLKESADRLRTLIKHAPTGASTIDEFRYLIIQRGAKPSHVKPFFVDRGLVRSGDSTPIKNVADVAAAWIERCKARPAAHETNPVHASEAFSLVTHFLAKGPSAVGLFIHYRDLGEADNIARHIEKIFARKTKSKSDNDAHAKTSIDRNE